MATKNEDDWTFGSIAFITFFALLAVAAFVLLVQVALAICHSAQDSRDKDIKFRGVCEYQHGKIATLDEGDTYICLKNGQVILRQK